MKHLEEYICVIEKALKEYLPKSNNEAQSNLAKSMEYSLMSGGKRIRSVLLMEFYRICGGKVEDVVPFAAALEMIHTYSLIHDDLPCMDNDDTRRGKPSNHIVYDENVALLAGDALLNLAFETMLLKENIEKVSAIKAIEAIRVLANGSGFHGMIGGQVIDLKNEGEKIDIDELKEMHSKKTGALIESACVMGCVLAGACPKKITAAKKFANSIGLAFQVVDDILDVTSDEKTLGKPIHSDIKSKKSTYTSILGIEQSQEIVHHLTEDGVNALKEFEEDTELLEELAVWLSQRKK